MSPSTRTTSSRRRESTGTASVQFQGVVAQWRGTQQQVRASLDSIGQVLGAAGTQYADAEASATRMFS